jgi:hypothetical protein
MSEVRVNKISPRSGTTVTLGDNGDTITIPSGVTLDASSGGLAGTLTTAAQPNITSLGTITSFTSTGIDDNATSTSITINSSGNVGIGESNPGNNLVVDGGANTTIRVQNDTPYYGDFQATTTGIQIRTVGSYPLILNTNQTERMRILHTGNVGIGTSSPGTALQVEKDWVSDYGSINISHSTNSLGGLGIRCNNVFKSALIYKGGTSGALLDIGTYSAEPILFRTNNSERMRITSAGVVGIGAIPPTGTSSSSYSQLQVGNSFVSDSEGTNSSFQLLQNAYVGSGNNNYAVVGSGASHSNRIMMTSGVISFARAYPVTADSQITYNESMRINSSGNVGIGTSSPSTKLEVSSSGDTIIKSKATTNNVLGGFEAHNNTGTSYLKVFQLGSAYGGTTFGGVTGNDQALIEAQAATSLVFSTQGGTPDIIFAPARTARMTIKNGGNVGIGTTAPDAKLSVADSKTGTEASSHLSIIGNGYSGHHWLDTSAYYIGQNSNARLLRIYSGSNEAVGVQLGAGGTSFGTYSDERLKKDITDLTNGLNKILALRPVNFKYKSDADDYRNRIGIIAQSIVGQVDEALDETKITADDETQYYNVRYQDLIPVLVKGIQEQQTQIQELEDRITTLENA